MRCSYCGVEVTTYPETGICAHCGGKLPERPAGTRCPSCGVYSTGHFCSACGCSLHSSVPPVSAPAQPVHIHVHQMPHGIPKVSCPSCGSAQVVRTKRGFRWGLAILGFFLIPGLGLLLGFCGSKQPLMQCNSCRRKWVSN